MSEPEPIDQLVVLARIREVTGDHGRRMQDELVDFIAELKRDSDRFQWLMLNSTIPEDLDKEIQLVVTKKAVAKCHGTHLPEYQTAVREAIDYEMKKDKA